jgi:hypothetical protein
VALTAAPASAGESVAAAPARKYPVVKKHVQRYRLRGWELKQIKSAQRWAKTAKARQVRRCESGDRYTINTGNGYYGAWQFAAGTWRASGGGRYSAYAHQSPKFAQDHIAWRLWKRSGWGPWGCA